jgi:hypothetical protein
VSDHRPWDRAIEADLVFNIVWTGDVFHHLRWFLLSLLEQTNCRYRFLANNCTAASRAEMDAFAEQRSDRVVEVIECPYDWMVPHGTALDVALRERDDGEFFCFIDTDIKARRPFLDEFLRALDGVDALTSGVEIWTDVNTLREEEAGIGGRHFYDHDGFVFGSPHFAMYRRAALLDTCHRWNIGFHVASKRDMSEGAWARMVELGKDKWVYDTGKVLNILLQADGHELIHREHDALVHIGGLSHFLAPPEIDFTDPEAVADRGKPMWVNGDEVTADRAAVAEFTAEMLKELDAGRTAPEIPPEAEGPLVQKLRSVRLEMIDMVRPQGRTT